MDGWKRENDVNHMFWLLQSTHHNTTKHQWEVSDASFPADVIETTHEGTSQVKTGFDSFSRDSQAWRVSAVNIDSIKHISCFFFVIIRPDTLPNPCLAHSDMISSGCIMTPACEISKEVIISRLFIGHTRTCTATSPGLMTC